MRSTPSAASHSKGPCGQLVPSFIARLAPSSLQTPWCTASAPSLTSIARVRAAHSAGVSCSSSACQPQACIASCTWRRDVSEVPAANATAIAFILSDNKGRSTTASSAQRCSAASCIAVRPSVTCTWTAPSRQPVQSVRESEENVRPRCVIHACRPRASGPRPHRVRVGIGGSAAVSSPRPSAAVSSPWPFAADSAATPAGSIKGEAVGGTPL